MLVKSSRTRQMNDAALMNTACLRSAGWTSGSSLETRKGRMPNRQRVGGSPRTAQRRRRLRIKPSSLAFGGCPQQPAVVQPSCRRTVLPAARVVGALTVSCSDTTPPPRRQSTIRAREKRVSETSCAGSGGLQRKQRLRLRSSKGRPDPAAIAYRGTAGVAPPRPRRGGAAKAWSSLQDGRWGPVLAASPRCRAPPQVDRPNHCLQLLNTGWC